MAYAARHPEHIAHLMIVDSAAPKIQDTVFLFKNIYPETTAREDGLAFAVELGDEKAIAADLHEYMTMIFYSPQARDAFLARSSSFVYRQNGQQGGLERPPALRPEPGASEVQVPDARRDRALRLQRRAVGGLGDPPGDPGLGIRGVREERAPSVLRRAGPVSRTRRCVPIEVSWNDDYDFAITSSSIARPRGSP